MNEFMNVWIKYFEKSLFKKTVHTPERMHCNGNSVYIFLSWKLRGLSPRFHIHVSVGDLYIPRIGPHISSSRKGRPIVGIYRREAAQSQKRNI
jgi:hypothetical protein